MQVVDPKETAETTDADDTLRFAPRKRANASALHKPKAKAASVWLTAENPAELRSA